MSSRSIFSKEDLLSPNLELPSIAKLASIFRTRKFKLELLPYKEGEIRLFKANCASCNYSTIVKWPINTTHLNNHYRNKHFNINYNNNSCKTWGVWQSNYEIVDLASCRLVLRRIAKEFLAILSRIYSRLANN
jgi:hypothetical protein